MLHRVTFLRDEHLPCGHFVRKSATVRVVHSKHRAKAIYTPIRCPECGSTVMARFIRSH